MFTVKFKGCPQVAVSSQILRLRVDSGRARRFDAPFTPGLLRRSNSRAAAVTGRARTGKGRWRSRPISRVLSWTVIPLGATSPLRSSSLPGPDAGRVMRSLFGLAPGGVCRAGLLPGSRCALTAPFHPCLIPRHPAAAFPEGTWPMLRIVRSPDWGRTGVARAIGGIFLLHFPSARAAQALPGTVPCGARTFLGIVSDDATVWPAPPSAILRLSPPSIGESRDQVQLFETWSLDSGWGCGCRGNSICFRRGPSLQDQSESIGFGRGPPLQGDFVRRVVPRPAPTRGRGTSGLHTNATRSDEIPLQRRPSPRWVAWFRWATATAQAPTRRECPRSTKPRASTWRKTR